MIMENAIVALVTGILSAGMTYLLSKKKEQAGIDNLVANTAAKIVEASNLTITNLTTRITKSEEKTIYLTERVKHLEQEQKKCEEREKKQNLIIDELKTKLEKRK